MMFQYVVDKYGSDRCALVSTFGIRKARAALRDTARVFEIDPEIADRAAKLIPQVYYDDDGEKTTDLSIQDSLEVVPELVEIQNEYPEWFAMASKLESLPNHASIHAAGTLISPVDLIDYIPLIRSKDSIHATALNLGDAEKAGFIKYDFLGLATLSVIDATEKDVNFKFDFIDNDFDDEEVWKLIGSKNTTSLFQIASRTYQDRMYRLKPQSIEELAACLALVRGPCISSEADKRYMDILEGKQEIETIHPFYDDATKDTLGILLYQEQLMQAVVNFGFTLEESYKIMKTIAKKKIEILKTYEESFMEKAAERDVPLEAAQRIWQILLDAGLYCFNKSHAVAYALLCYHSAYLKVHYPVAYMSNALTVAYFRKEEQSETVRECRRIGLRFLPLDVIESKWRFTTEDDMIRVGMCAIRSFGEKAANEVLNKRPFDDFEDFMERVTKGACGKRSIVPGIFSGLFDSFNSDRAELFTGYMTSRKEETPEEVKLQGGGNFNVHDKYDTIEEILLSAPLITNAVNNFATIGFSDFKKGKVFTVETVVRKVKKIKDRNKNTMAFLTLETADGYLDCTLFSEIYTKFKSYCKKDLVCKVKAKKDGEGSCIAISFE
jgi:DNA polymerase-3 subunit alpha